MPTEGGGGCRRRAQEGEAGGSEGRLRFRRAVAGSRSGCGQPYAVWRGVSGAGRAVGGATTTTASPRRFG